VAFTPAAGSSGRIRNGVGNTIIGGLTAWDATKALEVLKVTNFESPQDSNLVIWEEKISSNIADGKITVSGWIDLGTPTGESFFNIGTSALFDFLFTKTGTLGYHNVLCIVSNYKPGVKLREAQSFTAELEVNGIMPYQTAS
jgi:hypothetical protein